MGTLFREEFEMLGSLQTLSIILCVVSILCCPYLFPVLCRNLHYFWNRWKMGRPRPIVYMCRPNGSKRIGFVLRRDFQKAEKKFWKEKRRQDVWHGKGWTGEWDAVRIPVAPVFVFDADLPTYNLLKKYCYLQEAVFLVPLDSYGPSFDECWLHFRGVVK
ncbi:MAG: hypothetical protein Q7S57_03790 [bacterium]|nr:hypothetical protein [bacterium]